MKKTVRGKEVEDKRISLRSDFNVKLLNKREINPSQYEGIKSATVTSINDAYASSQRVVNAPKKNGEGEERPMNGATEHR